MFNSITQTLTASLLPKTTASSEESHIFLTPLMPSSLILSLTMFNSHHSNINSQFIPKNNCIFTGKPHLLNTFSVKVFVVMFTCSITQTLTASLFPKTTASSEESYIFLILLVPCSLFLSLTCSSTHYVNSITQTLTTC